MNNLNEVYLDILTHTSKWRYYKAMKTPKDLFVNRQNAIKFITDYISSGNKELLFDEGFPLEKVRIFHIVSTFFLGIHLSDIILGNTKEALKPSFKYLWYLTSLYHDYGYIIEDKRGDNPPAIFSNVAKIMKYKTIDQKPYAENNIRDNQLKFSTETIENYYRYCALKRSTVNHGIVGGLLLYDRLMKNYQHALEFEQNEPQNKVNCAEFYYKGLLYSECQHSYFVKIALAIINHNIWFCTKDEDVSVYKRYKISDLIIRATDTKDKRHLLSDDPFLFLLIIADTIEPVKAFRELNPQCVLEKINITNSENSIEIVVLDACLDTEHWFNNILDLTKWMQIDVKKVNDQEIVLSNFNQKK